MKSQILLSVLLFICFSTKAQFKLNVAAGNRLKIDADRYVIDFNLKNAAYGFYNAQGAILKPHSLSGFRIYNTVIDTCRLTATTDSTVIINVVSALGLSATLTILPKNTYCKFSLKLDDGAKASILARTGGTSLSYGLADHAAFKQPYSTSVTGYQDANFGALSDKKPSRLVSNFIIDPARGVACVNMEPGKKIISITEKEWAQGVLKSDEMPALYYFFGEPKQIYKDFLETRKKEGYPFYMPKYEWFGVGWEAFGALGWVTNEQTISENVNKYLSLGIPLSWMVIGSGFWPSHHPRFQATTSFGMWDPVKYTNPKALLDKFKAKGLKVILGLRIAFIPNGPYTAEGLQSGYFIKKEGQARLFKVGFPYADCYFLDANNPAAVSWYINLCRKWMQHGVDGFKEDLFGYEITDFDDDKLNAVNCALMDAGVYVMGRNAYLASVSDLHRYEDFNYNQNQDRGVINGLAYSYSGFPYTYPDIIGGTGLANNRFGAIDSNRIQHYLMRNAVYASVNPSMAFGYGTQELDDNPLLRNVYLKSANLHYQLHPYIYSEAVKAAVTGFPYTLTPLPLAYPHDGNVQDKENEKDRQYQWLIGESLMACPLYGNNMYETDKKNIYLPAGQWIDYDNGTKYIGPKLIKDFDMPVTKTPLFVGGKGILLVQDKSKDLWLRIYETGYQGTDEFTTRNFKKIKINISQPVTKSQIKITDKSTGKKVTAVYVNHAWQFRVKAGGNYQLN